MTKIWSYGTIYYIRYISRDTRSGSSFNTATPYIITTIELHAFDCTHSYFYIHIYIHVEYITLLLAPLISNSKSAGGSAPR